MVVSESQFYELIPLIKSTNRSFRLSLQRKSVTLPRSALLRIDALQRRKVLRTGLTFGTKKPPVVKIIDTFYLTCKTIIIKTIRRILQIKSHKKSKDHDLTMNLLPLPRYIDQSTTGDFSSFCF